MDTHLHHEQHFKSSDTLRDIVIGMSDGLTVPFALAAGLSGAVQNNKIILTAGIAEIIAGAIAMGLGGYLAGKTEVDHYNAELKREYDETYLYPEREREEVREVFADYGLNVEQQELIVEAISKDRDKWVDFMMRFELGLEKPDPARARQSAMNIGGAYVLGGLVPLSTYWFFDETPVSFKWSVAITLLALLVFGYFKNKIIGQNPLSGALRTMMIGATAAATAYLVASWFE